LNIFFEEENRLGILLRDLLEALRNKYIYTYSLKLQEGRVTKSPVGFPLQKICSKKKPITEPEIEKFASYGHEN